MHVSSRSVLHSEEAEHAAVCRNQGRFGRLGGFPLYRSSWLLAWMACQCCRDTRGPPNPHIQWGGGMALDGGTSARPPVPKHVSFCTERR